MRDLDLPRYGLQVVPYNGGLTMTRDGDYLASYNDHDMNRREIAFMAPLVALTVLFGVYPSLATDLFGVTVETLVADVQSALAEAAAAAPVQLAHR